MDFAEKWNVLLEATILIESLHMYNMLTVTMEYDLSWKPDTCTGSQESFIILFSKAQTWTGS
jgi:hypothetical protein